MQIPTVASVDEFVRWEEQQDERYEFAEGAVSLLPAALRRHEVIVVNLVSALRVALGAGHVSGSGLKLRTAQSIRYRDVLVGFDPRDHLDAPQLRYPTLVIEVLSESTSAIDRGAKADEYRTIETLREYVMIDSRKRWAQTIRRSGENWIVSLPITAGALRFESVELDMSFDEIYAGAEHR
jgi:Uma2 family endonuclease